MECYTRSIDCGSSNKNPTGTSVELPIELGHTAIKRSSPTAEGFTHDWKVYVKGMDGCCLDNMISKVVFHLHETFHRPKRGSCLNDSRFLSCSS